MTWTPNAATLRLQQIKAGKYRAKDAPADKTDKKEADGNKKGNYSAKKPIRKSAPKKSGNRIKPRSKKQRATMKALQDAYPAYLKDHPFCVIQSPVCTKTATCVNHKAGRGQNVVHDPKTWEPSCRECNGYIEEHDAWARENGHKISRLVKVKKNKSKTLLF